MTSGRLHNLRLTSLPQPATTGRLHRVEMSTALFATAGRLHEVSLESSGFPVVSIRDSKDGLEPGSTVGLTGTLESGTAAGYVWRQISGPAVTITDGDTLSASYVAPATLDGTELSFGLRAYDSLDRYSDELTVTDSVQWATERWITASGQVPLTLYLVGS